MLLCTASALLLNPSTPPQRRRHVLRVKVDAPADFVPPEPKPLQITRAAQIPDLLTGGMALAVRLATGTFVLGWRLFGTVCFQDRPVWGPMLTSDQYFLRLGPLVYRDGRSLESRPPSKPLIVYEYESSPYCRKVREAACLLDIPLELRPCPGARQGFSDQMWSETNSRIVPYMRDPNTGTAMFESEDIIDYMLETYGPTAPYDPKALWTLRGSFALWTGALAAIVRGLPASSRKRNAKPDNELVQPLVLYGYETSPFVRKTRETLCELCLPHIVVPCARGSRNRDLLYSKTGRFQVPYIEDPNTGVSLFESNEIVEYLLDAYTIKRRSSASATP